MNTTMNRCIGLTLVPVGLAAVVAVSGCSATANGQMKFDSPQKAVLTLGDVAGSGDQARMEKLFGKDCADVLSSGDPVADQQGIDRTKDAIRQKIAFEKKDDKTTIAVLGDDAWPFPIPLVKERGGWRFDTEGGREEIANRRVGRNEIQAIATLHALVDAQAEYFAGRHDGRTRTYASRVISTKGKHDGLYWPVPEGKPLSPLGPLVADATVEGYSTGHSEPQPYHGYFFRMLKAQGPNAPGGAMSYLDAKGAMTRGFAMIAWPSKYGNSGVMTFVVDRQGIVFQKDLGEGTSDAAAAITAYDPDLTWNPTPD